MNPQADMTQAPILYKIGADTFEVAPFTKNDFGAFSRYVQFAKWYQVKELHDVPQAKVDEVFDACLKTTVVMGSKDFEQVASTPDGLGEFAYLSLRHKQPNITREAISAMPIEHVTNIANIAAMLSTVNDTDDKKKVMADLLDKLRAKQLLA